MNRLIARFKEPQVWGFFLSVAILAIISIAFFYPDAVEGNTLRQADMQQGAANGQEALSFYESTGEKSTVDQLALRWHADLPDIAHISVERPFRLAQQRLRARTPVAVKSAVHDDVRLPDTALCDENAVVLRPCRRHSLGLLVIFHHHNRRRPHMEIRHTGLHSADNTPVSSSVTADAIWPVRRLPRCSP